MVLIVTAFPRPILASGLAPILVCNALSKS